MTQEQNSRRSSNGVSSPAGVGLGAVAWWKVIAAGAAIIVIGISLLFVSSLLVRPIGLIVIAIAISSALTPVIKILDRWMPRGVAIIVTYLVIVGLFVGLGWVVLPALISQLSRFTAEIPNLIALIQRILDQWDFEITTSLIESITGQLGTVGTQLLLLPLAFTASLFDLVLILFVSLYFLVELPKLKRFIESLLPDGEERGVLVVMREMGEAMGGYVRGTVINGAIVGLITFLGLTIIGVEFSLALGILAGVLEFIPILGPIIAAAAAILIALLDSPTKALTVLIFMVILQQIESHILVPNIMRTQTEISPLLVVLAVFAGATVGGLLGALVAIPLAAAIVVFVKRLVAPAVRRQTGAAPTDEND